MYVFGVVLNEVISDLFVKLKARCYCWVVDNFRLSILSSQFSPSAVRPRFCLPQVRHFDFFRPIRSVRLQLFQQYRKIDVFVYFNICVITNLFIIFTMIIFKIMKRYIIIKKKKITITPLVNDNRWTDLMTIQWIYCHCELIIYL